MTLWAGAETDSPDINRVVRFERLALLREWHEKGLGTAMLLTLRPAGCQSVTAVDHRCRKAFTFLWKWTQRQLLVELTDSSRSISEDSRDCSRMTPGTPWQLGEEEKMNGCDPLATECAFIRHPAASGYRQSSSRGALHRPGRENQVCHFLGLIHLDKMSSRRQKE